MQERGVTFGTDQVGERQELAPAQVREQAQEQAREPVWVFLLEEQKSPPCLLLKAVLLEALQLARESKSASAPADMDREETAEWALVVRLGEVLDLLEALRQLALSSLGVLRYLPLLEAVKA